MVRVRLIVCATNRYEAEIVGRVSATKRKGGGFFFFLACVHRRENQVQTTVEWRNEGQPFPLTCVKSGRRRGLFGREEGCVRETLAEKEILMVNIIQKRTPLQRNMLHWIERDAHVDVGSAVWERRHRMQDRSASPVRVRRYCGQSTRWKQSPMSVSVLRCERPEGIVN